MFDQSEYFRAWEARQLATGRCTKCSAPKSGMDRRFCARHRQWHIERCRRWRLAHPKPQRPRVAKLALDHRRLMRRDSEIARWITEHIDVFDATFGVDRPLYIAVPLPEEYL